MIDFLVVIIFSALAVVVCLVALPILLIMVPGAILIAIIGAILKSNKDREEEIIKEAVKKALEEVNE